MLISKMSKMCEWLIWMNKNNKIKLSKIRKKKKRNQKYFKLFCCLSEYFYFCLFMTIFILPSDIYINKRKHSQSPNWEYDNNINPSPRSLPCTKPNKPIISNKEKNNGINKEHYNQIKRHISHHLHKTKKYNRN